ncbi:glycoprotein-N-acetylgalactosamine 3-beta-galactosyltransferase 1-like [Fopius arisanus]|uniref:N-acetylgalactosaminide beta-1,3-galactosyltransferase n=1 Tax=Fopius arisanus TaxID=64838 RepID=A0A9R1T5S3_9HYME|nr:PREDICTED: glycoprotein-N-acetylgalactosamine 3-beta-galactosyltransferase 1-like [Fopius arisanus]XP_011303245.1 PREDICTED: glycoprotein-N-acetylgalactosamine 3-beta-galactosyltransferase 1-like [Fopius arisanus]
MYLRFVKSKLTFSVGFIIGFTSVILYVILNNDNSNNCKKPAQTFALWKREEESQLENQEEIYPLSYKFWLKNQNVQSHGISLDARYGPVEADERPSKALESHWLRSKVHVTCVVFVEKLKLAQSIKLTWGPRCNEVHYFSQDLEDAAIPVVKFPTKLSSSWHFLCSTMNVIWNKSSDSLSWIIFVKDDTIVLPENLRYLLAPLDHNRGYYLGHGVILWGQSYNVAQAGYVLSRGAFKKIIEAFNTHDKCVTGGKYWKKEDYYLGKHLAGFNIHPADTRDGELRGTFHGYPLQTLLWGIAKPGNYFTRALYPPGDKCCSPTSVTFSISEPDKLHTIDYVLYHLNVYQEISYYGNKAAPTPVPEQDVWKLALKEEFNITDVEGISDDKFYDIWRSKYSDPSQFIEKNHENMSHVLHSIITAYENDRRMVKNLP